MDPEEAPINGQPKQKPTEYVVLEMNRQGLSEEFPGPVFNVVGGITDGKPATFNGFTRHQAIKEATDESGTFIAVPARSFIPTSRVVQHKPVEKFTEAKFQ